MCVDVVVDMFHEIIKKDTKSTKNKFLKTADLQIGKLNYICTPSADVVELVDTLDLGSSAARRGGSTPFIRTKIKKKAGFQSWPFLIS